MNHIKKDLVDAQQKKQFTIRFLDRSIRFLAYSALSLIFLYIFSDSQNFLDESLFLILNTIISLCVLLFLFTFAAVLFKTFYIIKHKEKKYIFLFVLDIVLMVFSIITSIFFSFLIVAAKGIV